MPELVSSHTEPGLQALIILMNCELIEHLHNNV